jgi:hypothetical protein
VLVVDFEGIFVINQTAKFEDIFALFSKDKNGNWIFKSGGSKNEPVKLFIWKSIHNWRVENSEMLMLSTGQTVLKNQKIFFTIKYVCVFMRLTWFFF